MTVVFVKKLAIRASCADKARCNWNDNTVTGVYRALLNRCFLFVCVCVCVCVFYC